MSEICDSKNTSLQDSIENISLSVDDRNKVERVEYTRFLGVISHGNLAV